jgi:hypothetical protein
MLQMYMRSIQGVQHCVLYIPSGSTGNISQNLSREQTLNIVVILDQSAAFMTVFSEMLRARENDMAAALVEPADPWTPASRRTDRIQVLIVDFAAVFWGKVVVRNRDSGRLIPSVRWRYSLRWALGHNLVSS